MAGLGSPPNATDNQKFYEEYREVNANFRTLVDIRFKLLALVPTVSGLAIALTDQNTDADSPITALLSGLGLVVLLGIVAYDHRNSQLYYYLGLRLQFLEAQMKLPQAGKKPTDPRVADEGGGQYLDQNMEPHHLSDFCRCDTTSGSA